jgi:putative ABC transport system ATP-binding protein
MRVLLRRNKIGFMFQSFNLLSRFTARENIELALIHHKISKEKMKQKIIELVKFLDLSDKMNSLNL